MAKKYYAIKKGLVPGIYDNWPEAQAQVKGFPRAHHHHPLIFTIATIRGIILPQVKRTRATANRMNVVKGG